ncbi:MAG: hypothetical protein JNL74_15520 [Fibrobacteres bacterium]|nr:hypothetical protein [Fibrobacterota bacterium]
MNHQLILAFIFALAVTSFAYTPPDRAVTIRKKIGALEYAPAKSVKFVFADTSTVIYNGDQLRTGNGVSALLKTASNATILLSERSRIRVEIKTGRLINTVSINLYSGSCFISTPDDADKETIYIIQTITGSLECRLAVSASLTVDTLSGSTGIWVIGGNPVVRSTSDRKALTLKGNNQIYVDMGKALPQPTVIDASLFLKDLEWVNLLERSYIQKEIERTSKSSERQRAILTLKLEGDLVFCRFRDNSGYMGVWDTPPALTKAGYDLFKSGGLPAILFNGNDSTLPDSLLNKAGGIVQGVIHSFDLRRESKGATEPEKGYIVFTAEIGYLLLEPKSGRILADMRRTISDQIHESAGNSWKDITTLPFDIQHPSFSRTIVGSNLKKIILELNKQLQDTYGL